MAEPDDLRPGMGPAPRGPSFVPSGPPQPPDILGPPDQQPAISTWIHPPRSAWPAVLSILVIALVTAVVAVGSLLAYRNDRNATAPAPATVPAPRIVTTAPDRIDFITEDGSGQLIMRTRAWVSDGQPPPTSGSYLRVEIELVCTEGEVDYDPYLFQAFDQSGQLFEMAVEGTGGRVLEVGTLTEGQRVRGLVAFDMPRGEVMLLMSDEWENTITALQVPD